MKRRRESGQVLITGIVMMAILLLVIIYAFDVHNVIRAKLKVDIAQQSAAMTGANWQKESLNLLGEINLLKASALLMEGSDNWKTPLPDREEKPEEWRKEMQSRVDLLTEMQTRISFLGPLIGFAAAQQSAKNNGLDRVPGALDNYLELLEVDQRYDEAQGGAAKYINNYAWKEPYTSLIRSISSSGIAVFPNARTAGMPSTRPSQLTNARFYEEIQKTASAIAANDPPKSHHWELLCSIVKTMDDQDFQGKWWQIDYSNNRFPNESEIFTLGVEFDSDYQQDTIVAAASMKPDLEIYGDPGTLPAQMKWCIPDQWWFPDFYRAGYSGYERDHYDYWFGGGVLRKEVKEEYRYEGPAAYVEGYADVTARVNIRPSTRPYGNSRRKRDALEAVKGKDNDAILLRKERTTSRVGTRRGRADDSNVSTSYRPGSIAKVLGGLKDETPPIEIDMFLPVFKQVSPMPTFMPVPYGFQVLKPGYSNLEKFLSWLAWQEDLNGTPPAGCEDYLEALRFLANGVKARAEGKSGKVDREVNSHVSGRALRYYGYNHKFDKGAFENEFKERLWEWYKVRDSRVFQQKVPDGPGYLQEPALFSSTPRIKRVKVEEKDASGKIILKEYYVISRESSKGAELYKLDEETHKVALPDAINGGTAHRVYTTIGNNASSYYVINSKGQIVLNGSPDPTILYNQEYWGGGGGTCNCEGECKCKSTWNPNRYDGDKGPVRL